MIEITASIPIGDCLALWSIIMTKKLGVLSFVAITCLAFALGYNFMRSNIAADLYRDRLREAVKENEALRQTFNEAVKKTIVTELLVQDDETVCVVFVNADGTERVVPTTFKMGSEVYVDFIVRDNRLFLRRVFDENTKPKEALHIDPQMQTVDWKSINTPRGSATYAQLNKKGRWTVSVAGNGALQLTKADDNANRQPLTVAPSVKEYAVIEKEMNAKIEEIGISDVMQSILGGKK